MSTILVAFFLYFFCDRILAVVVADRVHSGNSVPPATKFYETTSKVGTSLVRLNPVFRARESNLLFRDKKNAGDINRRLTIGRPPFSQVKCAPELSAARKQITSSRQAKPQRTFSAIDSSGRF